MKVRKFCGNGKNSYFWSTVKHQANQFCKHLEYHFRQNFNFSNVLLGIEKSQMRRQKACLEGISRQIAKLAAAR